MGGLKWSVPYRVEPSRLLPALRRFLRLHRRPLARAVPLNTYPDVDEINLLRRSALAGEADTGDRDLVTIRRGE